MDHLPEHLDGRSLRPHDLIADDPCDDPVVAGDAIKRELAAGTPRGIAAWLGPTRLATAILYATITNIVAYLPFPTGERKGPAPPAGGDG